MTGITTSVYSTGRLIIDISDETSFSKWHECHLQFKNSYTRSKKPKKKKKRKKKKQICSSFQWMKYLCVRVSWCIMRIQQLLLIFRRTILAEKVLESFSFLWSHVYTSRMKPESKVACWRLLWSKCIIHNLPQKWKFFL